MENSIKLRPLYIAKILYERTDDEHSLSTAELIDILEKEYGIASHRATVKSDIEILKEFGFDIQEIKSTQNRYNLLNRLFDLPELKLLIDAVESSKFITKTKSAELVRKLGKLAGGYNADKLNRNLFVEGRIKPENEKIYLIVDTINEAINQGKKISFLYFQYNQYKEHELKHDGEPYVFSPHYLVWEHDCYYVVGIYDDTKEMRNFRIDRIAKCPDILDNKADKLPENFDIAEYVNTNFRMYNNCQQCNVELICDNSVMDSIVDIFGSQIEIKKNDNNSFLLNVNVAVNHIFFSWIFGFEGLVKIKEPKNIKNKYKLMLKKASELV